MSRSARCGNHGCRLHDASGRTSAPQLFRHEAHVRVHVGEYRFIAGAEMIVPMIIDVMDAMLRTTSVAGETPFALHTGFRQIGFCHAKSPLLLAVDQTGQVIPPDVAKLMRFVDVVIAGIHIAVLFDDEDRAAGRPHDAQARHFT